MKPNAAKFEPPSCAELFKGTSVSGMVNKGRSGLGKALVSKELRSVILKDFQKAFGGVYHWQRPVVFDVVLVFGAGFVFHPAAKSEDVRTVRVHLPLGPSDEHRTIGIDAFFHDQDLREQRKLRMFCEESG
eukprot:g33395.t1